MKIYKTKWVTRFTRRQRLEDDQLRDAIAGAETGLVDADLGGGLIKLRVARPGQGKSGGYRMLIAYRQGARAVFLYGFAKKERDNIAPDELLTLREIGAIWLAATDAAMAQAVKEHELEEITDDQGIQTEPADQGPA